MGSCMWGYKSGSYSYNPYEGTYNHTYNYPKTLKTL